MLSSFKRLLVKMFVFSSFFSRVIFLMSPQIGCLKWCKVAKIAFLRFFSRVISNVYANALLEAMLNQNCFICAKFLHIKFANVTPFDRPEEMHSTSVVWCCYIVIFFHIFLLGLAKQLFIPVPLPSPNRGNPPILQMAFLSLFFVSKVKKKHISGHN